MKFVITLMPLVAMVHCLTFTLDDRDTALSVVSEKFLSVALDCSSIESRYASFNLSDPYLTRLVAHLAPMYFRIGGTYADRIVFAREDQTERLQAADITFLSSDYLRLYQFTQNAGVSLIFDLNSLLRNDDGSWNSENAREMIAFSSEHQMQLDWELGNEPDLYQYIYETNVAASQLAADYQTLRDILDEFEIYKSANLVGNDMFDVGGSESNQEYLSTFLKAAAHLVHAVTWHQYYFAGRDATEELFLSPSTFNYLEQRINVVKKVVSSSGSGNKVWLGETSSAYNGGAANMSNRFLGTFLWLDKLGLGAKLGLDVIIRQTIYVDNYALLDPDYVPNPDWWLSVIYKKLVGTNVLSLSNDGSSDNTVRLYAHCAKDAESSVVVFGFNVNGEKATISIEGFEADEDVLVYQLNYDENIYSQTIKLNGEILKVSSEGDLPDFQPTTVPNRGTFTLEPHSLVFWVFTNTNVNACD
ncbi:heparanase [Dendroctonus ponderosae]